ncbi:conserved hypothetical protein [Tolumonas auensis DSM 9187]|uniref:DUF4382 domain-containing protein n=1 Tax=Tolumonas auensis (strain DSM 9187 / NBRC 110442 / TA 4) TaxID=595494 RepID=C4LCL4_TOLAT|nr:DUF4382 domain-containing protein [Tolumonas auensis]ACQ92578.1 conserved hypothetical protein [Tolumonas auensis DSM 9187]
MKHQSGYAFTLLLLLAGCGGGGGSDSSTPTTTKLNLAISDAPVDSAQQVCIAVSALSLKQEGVTAEKQWGPLDLIDTNSNDGCLPVGYAIPKDNNGNPTFFYLDLLKYQDGDKHMLLSDEVIPSGKYEQLRLIVLDGTDKNNDLVGNTPLPASYVTEQDGTVKALEVPSDVLKFHSFNPLTSGVLDYQVEFNLRHAMVLPGHEEYYKLKPNGVKLLNVDVLSTISGSVAVSDANCGTTALSNGDVGVYLYKDTVTDYQGIDYDTAHNGPVLSGMVSDTDADGIYTYQLNYVEAGSYKLALVCNASGDFLTEAGNSSGYGLQVADPVQDVPVQDPAVSQTTSVIADF